MTDLPERCQLTGAIIEREDERRDRKIAYLQRSLSRLREEMYARASTLLAELMKDEERFKHVLEALALNVLDEWYAEVVENYILEMRCTREQAIYQLRNDYAIAKPKIRVSLREDYESTALARIHLKINPVEINFSFFKS